MKKVTPEIIKTTAEETPSKDANLVNGRAEDTVSVQSRETGKSSDTTCDSARDTASDAAEKTSPSMVRDIESSSSECNSEAMTWRKSSESNKG